MTAQENVPPTPISDDVMRAIDTANFLYPQMRGGLTALAGAAAVREVLAGRMTWEEMTRARPSEAQVDAHMALIPKVHRHAGVAWTVTEQDRVKVKDLAGWGWLDECVIVSARYAADMLAEKWPGLVHKLPRGPHDAGQNEKAAAAMLFETRDGGFRPEAVALGHMWDTADLVMRDGPARRQARPYREMVAAVSSSGLPESDKNSLSAASRRLLITTALRPMLCREIESTLPALQQETGIEIRPQVVRNFIGTML